MNRLFHAYKKNLPYFVIPSTAVSFSISISNEMIHNNYKNTTTKITNVIKISSVGFLIGVTYPISFPLLTGLVLSMKNNR